MADFDLKDSDSIKNPLSHRLKNTHMKMVNYLRTTFNLSILL